MRRFSADAKYSSLKERIEAPRTVVDRFVFEEKVASMSEAGTLVTEIVEVEFAVKVMLDSVDVALSRASCGIELISMIGSLRYEEFWERRRNEMRIVGCYVGVFLPDFANFVFVTRSKHLSIITSDAEVWRTSPLNSTPRQISNKVLYDAT